jgi:N-acetylglucosamine-6-phosphate deacetylase
LLLGTELVEGAVVVQDGRIVEIDRGPVGDLPEPVLDAYLIAPGFVDLQVNGGFGVEVGDDPEAIRRLAARLPERGVTGFLPTAITSTPEAYARLYEAFASARDAPGARILGLHLEGPFLSPRRPGAHRRDLIAAAPAELLDQLLAGDALRLMTLAPERPSALGSIRRLRERNVVVALGHTDATYEAFERAVDAGATMVTHIYNAMSPFEHRAPGAVGAALVDDRITVGLICDGIHIHPAGPRLALRCKGPERIALVSDLISAAGMPPGTYELGGETVYVDEAAARRADGTLSGSIVTLDQAVRNVIDLTGTSIASALRMASETPAAALGLEHLGRIVEGVDRDHGGSAGSSGL